MITVQAINNTAGTLSYVNKSITIDVASTATIPNNVLIPFSQDANVNNDIAIGKLLLSDTVNTYSGESALVFLQYNTKAIVNADGSMNYQGNISSLTADSGNPVKVGAVYNTTESTPTNGQRTDLQSNQFSHLAIQFRNKFRNLTGNATTTVKSGTGTLHSVMIGNNSSGGTITIYDNTAGSGTVILAFTVGTPSGGLLSGSGVPGPFETGPLGIEFSTGLTIVTAGSTANNLTIIYR